jgi:hypothetical protein
MAQITGIRILYVGACILIGCKCMVQCQLLKFPQLHNNSLCSPTYKIQVEIDVAQFSYQYNWLKENLVICLETDNNGWHCTRFDRTVLTYIINHTLERHKEATVNNNDSRLVPAISTLATFHCFIKSATGAYSLVVPTKYENPGNYDSHNEGEQADVHYELIERRHVFTRACHPELSALSIIGTTDSIQSAALLIFAKDDETCASKENPTYTPSFMVSMSQYFVLASRPAHVTCISSPTAEMACDQLVALDKTTCSYHKDAQSAEDMIDLNCVPASTIDLLVVVIDDKREPFKAILETMHQRCEVCRIVILSSYSVEGLQEEGLLGTGTDTSSWVQHHLDGIETVLVRTKLTTLQTTAPNAFSSYTFQFDFGVNTAIMSNVFLDPTDDAVLLPLASYDDAHSIHTEGRLWHPAVQQFQAEVSSTLTRTDSGFHRASKHQHTSFTFHPCQYRSETGSVLDCMTDWDDNNQTYRLTNNTIPLLGTTVAMIPPYSPSIFHAAQVLLGLFYRVEQYSQACHALFGQHPHRTRSEQTNQHDHDSESIAFYRLSYHMETMERLLLPTVSVRDYEWSKSLAKLIVRYVQIKRDECMRLKSLQAHKDKQKKDPRVPFKIYLKEDIHKLLGAKNDEIVSKPKLLLIEKLVVIGAMELRGTFVLCTYSLGLCVAFDVLVHARVYRSDVCR